MPVVPDVVHGAVSQSRAKQSQGLRRGLGVRENRGTHPPCANANVGVVVLANLMVRVALKVGRATDKRPDTPDLTRPDQSTWTLSPPNPKLSPIQTFIITSILSTCLPGPGPVPVPVPVWSFLSIGVESILHSTPG